MSEKVTLFDPTAPPAKGSDPSRLASNMLTGLAGRTVGFIDNAKPNFGFLVDNLAELLKSKYAVARVVKRRKPSASVPATPEVIAALSAECDLVITGSGD